ncbi:MAG: AmmeMemoRadiSam system protein B [Patescibacteria group bacterium]
MAHPPASPSNSRTLKRWHFIVVLAIALPGIVAISSTIISTVDAGNPKMNRPQSVRILETPYYYPNQFQRSVERAIQLGPAFPEKKVLGAIIPHDFTRGEYIAHFFQGLQSQQPQRIILIGPNHHEVGSGLVQTTAASWKTANGLVEADQGLVQALVDGGYALANDHVAVNEHSVSAIMPFIGHYLPGTTVVPVILKAELRLPELQRLVALLDQHFDDQTVVVAAVDFSHYLSVPEAEAHDHVTRAALETLDYQTILSFGARFNDYLDSPPSIALLLFWLSQRGITGYTVLHHANSGILAGTTAAPTTSYFEMVYYK